MGGGGKGAASYLLRFHWGANLQQNIYYVRKSKGNEVKRHPNL